jgi:dienelactone hydrolase
VLIPNIMACAGCFAGHVHSGEPQGTVVDLYGYKTYITPVPSSSTSDTRSNSAILYLPDFFSHKLVNNKLLADRYAAATGFTVYFPDIVRGGGVDPSWLPTFEPIMDPATPWWIKVYSFLWCIPLLPQMQLGQASRAWPEVLRYAKAVRESLGKDGKLGVAGFCWGGFGAIKLCMEEGVVDAVFTGHPSRLKAPEDFVEAVLTKVPVSVAVPEEDPMFDKGKAEEVEAVLRGKRVVSGKDGYAYDFTVYEGAKHGFCVRLKGGKDEETAAGAEKQAVEWFKRYLS